MKKIIRLTESDLMRLVKRVISEQNEKPNFSELQVLSRKIKNKFPNFCIGNKIMPYNEEVKKFQIEFNSLVDKYRKTYLSKAKQVKVDGVIGPEMRNKLCAGDSSFKIS